MEVFITDVVCEPARRLRLGLQSYRSPLQHRVSPIEAASDCWDNTVVATGSTRGGQTVCLVFTGVGSVLRCYVPDKLQSKTSEYWAGKLEGNPTTHKVLDCALKTLKPVYPESREGSRAKRKFLEITVSTDAVFSDANFIPWLEQTLGVSVSEEAHTTLYRSMRDLNVQVGTWAAVSGELAGSGGRFTRAKYEYVDPTVTPKEPLSAFPALKWVVVRLETFDDANGLPISRMTEKTRRVWMVVSHFSTGKTYVHVRLPPTVAPEFRDRLSSHIADDDVKLLCYKDQERLLVSWRRMLVTEDPSVVLDYNERVHSLEYLTRLLESSESKAIPLIASCKPSYTVHHVDNKARSEDVGEAVIPGRVYVDVMAAVRRRIGDLRTYSLLQVAERLGCTAPSSAPPGRVLRMNTHFAGNPEAIGDIIKVLVSEAVTVGRIAQSMELLMQVFDMARLTRTTVRDVLARGSSYLTYHMLRSRAEDHGYVLNSQPSWLVASGANRASYEGGSIRSVPQLIPPGKGVTLVLDMASYYPSLMVEYNLCPTTLKDPKAEKLSDRFDMTTPGLTPRVLMDLMKARKNARKKNREIEQRNLKIQTNSHYGYYGTGINSQGVRRTTTLYPCKPVASTTCLLGRDVIQAAHELSGLEREFVFGEETRVCVNPSAPPCKKPCIILTTTVVHSVVDSIMVHVSADSEDALQDCEFVEWLGRELAQAISVDLKRRYETERARTTKGGIVRMEFETWYTSACFFGGAIYAAAKGDRTLVLKGASRDDPPFFLRAREEVLRCVLVDDDPISAWESFVGCLSTLSDNAYSLDDYTLTTSLGRTVQSTGYAVAKQDSPLGLDRRAGDRVAYIYGFPGSSETRKAALVVSRLKPDLTKADINRHVYLSSVTNKFVKLMTSLGFGEKATRDAIAASSRSIARQERSKTEVSTVDLYISKYFGV